MCKTTAFPHLLVNSNAFPIHALRGCEQLAQPFSFTIELKLADTAPDLSLLQPAQLVLPMAANARSIFGIITDIKQHYKIQHRGITLTLVSTLALLQYEAIPRLFMMQSWSAFWAQLSKNFAFLPHQFNDQSINHQVAFQPHRQLPKETSLAFLQRVLAQHQLYYWCENHSPQEIFHLVTTNHSCPYLTPLQLTYQPQQPYPDVDLSGITDLRCTFSEYTELVAKSHCPTLQPGYCFQLNAEALHPTLSTDYILTRVNHYFQAGEFYYNRLTCRPRLQNYQIPATAQPSCPPLFMGTIAAGQTAPPQYAVQLNHIRDPAEAIHPTVQQLVHYHTTRRQSRSGLTTRLSQGNAVLISCHADDPMQLAILGSLPQGTDRPLVTAENPEHHLLRTPHGHTCRFADDTNNAHIELRTGQYNNTLQLHDHPQHSQITLSSPHSHIAIHAATDLSLITHAQYLGYSGGNMTFSGNQAVSIQGQQQQVQLTSAADFLTQVQNHLAMNAGQKVILNSATSSAFLIHQDANITTHGQHASLRLHGEQLSIHAQQDLLIAAKDQLEIRLDAQTSLQLDCQGHITLQGKTVKLDAADQLQLSGHVYFMDS